jgi:CheY-like chemotaxis protein
LPEVVILAAGEVIARHPRSIALNLPKASGLAVLGSPRRSVKCKDTPVVILSSSEMQKEKDEAAQLSANRFIWKPVRLEELLALGAVFNSILQESPSRS